MVAVINKTDTKKTCNQRIITHVHANSEENLQQQSETEKRHDSYFPYLDTAVVRGDQSERDLQTPAAARHLKLWDRRGGRGRYKKWWCGRGPEGELARE